VGVRVYQMSSNPPNSLAPSNPPPQHHPPPPAPALHSPSFPDPATFRLAHVASFSTSPSKPRPLPLVLARLIARSTTYGRSHPAAGRCAGSCGSFCPLCVPRVTDARAPRGPVGKGRRRAAASTDKDPPTLAAAQARCSSFPRTRDPCSHGSCARLRARKKSALTLKT
jgi:hypothetical protein